MTNEETILDALKWVDALIEHYSARYPPEKTLDGIRGEVKTCINLSEVGGFETRFKEATEQLKRPSLFSPRGCDKSARR